jgi:hypothetical protein
VRFTRWRIAAVLVLLAAMGAGGGLAWLNQSRPAPLGLSSIHPRTPSASPPAADPLVAACRPQPPPAPGFNAGFAGVWLVQPGSVVGYRAHEKFAHLTAPHEAVARTDRVAGWLLVASGGDTYRVEAGCVAVQLAGLRSVDKLPGFDTADRDKSARDFLHTFAHPYAIFQPSAAPVPAGVATGSTVQAKVEGKLEINGVALPATFNLQLKLTSAQVAVAGSTMVMVEDYGVDVPRTVGDFVAVDPHITLELSLVLLQS